MDVHSDGVLFVLMEMDGLALSFSVAGNLLYWHARGVHGNSFGAGDSGMVAGANLLRGRFGIDLLFVPFLFNGRWRDERGARGDS